MNADPSETLVTSAKCFYELQGLVCNHACASWNFSSGSTFLYDCFPWMCRYAIFDKLWYTCLCRNSLVWIFTSKPPDSLSVSFLTCERFICENSLIQYPIARETKEYKQAGPSVISVPIIICLLYALMVHHYINKLCSNHSQNIHCI